MDTITQHPLPGDRILLYCGDSVTFTVSHPPFPKGAAWLRANIGHVAVSRRQIIESLDSNRTPLGEDWFDIAMTKVDSATHSVTLPLCQVGHFEAKVYVLPDVDDEPLWPVGDNTVINVKPAELSAANTVYNAFVRQFGITKGAQEPNPLINNHERILDQSGYAVIPPSGTFRDLQKELDFIIDDLGCRIVLLLPIGPTPTTYGRHGRFGSPYAALSFFTVDPSLAEFDLTATPLEQFQELADAIHMKGARLFLDIAVNHTGWAADLHAHHPEWLARDEQGKIIQPGAWGIVWEDLARLDYSHEELWQYVAEVFLTWCRRDVDGFRCDAGYMIPAEAWTYIITKVREGYPDTIFLLEGLGGPPESTQQLLNVSGFDCAYSELFQNYDQEEIQRYMSYATDLSLRDGVMIHFAETHDNPRLAATSHQWAKMRTAVAALLSDRGAFGFANGVEWFAQERISVHESSSLNWGSGENQVSWIAALNRLLSHHPAFVQTATIQFVHTERGNFIALHRLTEEPTEQVLILINLDAEKRTIAHWKPINGFNQGTYLDLLSGQHVTADGRFDLAPGQVLCLGYMGSEAAAIGSTTPDSKAIERAEEQAEALLPMGKVHEPHAIHWQRIRSKVMESIVAYAGLRDIEGADIDHLCKSLLREPRSICQAIADVFGMSDKQPHVTLWLWPRDLQRDVMVPPENFLLIQCPHPFRITLLENSRVIVFEESIQQNINTHFLLLSPLPERAACSAVKMEMKVYQPDAAHKSESNIMLLSSRDDQQIALSFARNQCKRERHTFLGTNGRGAMMHTPVSFGELDSRYDGLIAANLHDWHPVDRHMMLSRFRAWITYQDYSQELGPRCQTNFTGSYESVGIWRFLVPIGQGKHVTIEILISMENETNGIVLQVKRVYFDKKHGDLDLSQAVELIVRADIEDRGFHETVKAHRGQEPAWEHATSSSESGFVFAPAEQRRLSVDSSDGTYTHQPEWQYRVKRSLEAERGLDSESDLYSPGFFTFVITSDQPMSIHARVGHGDLAHADTNTLLSGFGATPPFSPSGSAQADAPAGAVAVALAAALHQYIVRRDELHTVIAGYPWFLDWGRDTLIVVRGIIASGNLDIAQSIIKSFAGFEQQGTLPNMIRGNDASNRNTSDATLWLFVACADLLSHTNDETFLSEQSNGRTIQQVLVDIGNSLEKGAQNGVVMDPQSGLLFSPAHFSWMDTNHPAGTARMGYPIEIQALWYRATDFLWHITGENRWLTRSEQISSSIQTLYFHKDRGYFSDCLHCSVGVSAHNAVSDDALRPNQLLALTLGAVNDLTIARAVLSSCEELLVPGAIRSLADREVSFPQPVTHNGSQLNDPIHPYWGTYEGDEDTRRKPAYHNGTAWTWQFPLYAEAWLSTYGKESKNTALAWLNSSIPLLGSGCIGHIPEILDGNSPHKQRGCDAQAWGVSELLRVWLLVSHL